MSAVALCVQQISRELARGVRRFCAASSGRRQVTLLPQGRPGCDLRVAGQFPFVPSILCKGGTQSDRGILERRVYLHLSNLALVKGK